VALPFGHLDACSQRNVCLEIKFSGLESTYLVHLAFIRHESATPMSQISPVRPRRRAAARRERVVNSSDDEEENKPQVKEEAGEDEFTPAPQRLTRRPSRRDTQDARATPQTISGVRRNKVNDVLDTAEILSPAPKSVIRNNKNPPPARRSVRAGRKSQSPSATELPALLPTPRPSNSPAPGIQPVMPLADITGTVNNEQLPTAKTPKPIKKLELIYAPIEKPMDIVIRTRAKVVPVPEESSGPRSRIVITYLILTNFKSYAGRQEVGPFHSSFSSVVGPNGSGKSNVIDSLLFVFGFRASKMRQGKISALIHNSAAFPDLEYCEVAVHFQEVVDQAGGKHEVVPDSSLVISRKAFKNNASKYYINMSESNFTAVTTLLRDRGVDLDHKRFLILQGEVESIAQMKPKAATEHDDGLLEYLEDIIGTSKYKGPIEEAAAETATLNDVCLEKSGRVQHVEKEKKSLEGKKDAALAFIKNENELAMKQSALYQIFVNECEDNIQVTEEAVVEMQSQLDCELEKHRGGEASIQALQKQYATEMERFGHLEQSTQATLKELAKMDKEAVKFEEKKKHLNAKAKKLEKSLTAAQSGASESAAYVQRLSDDLERNTGTVAEIECHLRSEETELNSIRENLRGKTQGLSNQINERQKSLEPWANRINEKRSMVAIAQSELAILQESNNAGAQAIADAQGRLTRFEVARAEKLATTEAHKAKQQDLEAEVRDLQATLETLANKEPGARSKLSSARQKADEARANFSNSQTQGNVLTGLMRLAESGRVKGFHGRLGNLGAIDEKYDFAISTACPALDNLVVDSVEVGQQCIEYLRKSNLGRANFILLDRLSQRDVSPMQTPENVPRLFDLVRSKDDKFLPAFFSVLQNTLVAEDLEQANRIAYGAKRWRVVTLNGQLIDKSGTMSGGGTRVAKGAMSSKIIADMSKEQVTKLEADQEMLEQDFQSIQKQQHATLAAERELHERMPELITEIQKCLLEIESLDRTMEDTQRRCEELVGAQQPNGSDKDRVVTLQRTISSLEAEIMVLQTETAGIEAEINVLQEKIMEIGGVKLRSQKAKVDGLKEQIGTLTEEISNAEVSKAKTKKQKHKHEKARGDAEAELEGVAGDLERLNAEMQSQSREASDSKREAERAQEVIASRKGACHGLIDVIRNLTLGEIRFKHSKPI